jgi:hypothetical protein
MKIKLRTKSRNIEFLMIEHDGQIWISTHDGILLGRLEAQDMLNDDDEILKQSYYLSFQAVYSNDTPSVQAVQDNFCTVGIYYPKDEVLE